MNSSTMIEEDRKISRHTCGEWLYAGNACQAVSYTHLTLPTIYSV